MGIFNELAAGSSKLINSADETVRILEEVSDAISIIDIDHHRIHEGQFYEFFVQKTSLSSGGTYDVSFTTSSSPYIHYRLANVSPTADKLTMDLYEGNTISGGATITSYNRNRNSTATTTLIIVTSATITALGTNINKVLLGGGSDVGVNALKIGGTFNPQGEWILKPSTNYNLRFTNGSSAANTFVVNNVFYEALKV